MALRWLRISFWIAAFSLGGAQTWFTRHRIFSDGISYLDIAQHYARGDWHGALNAYWSPLYSWAIAAYLVILRPSSYWETSSLHVINFAAFLAGCWAFEGFVRELLTLRPDRDGLSAQTITIAGYMAILHAGLILVGIAPVCPDMIAFFLIGMAAWLMARLAGGRATSLHCAALGVTLGLAYLDRTAFAPLSAVYLFAAGIWLTRNRLQLMLCAACIVAVGSPFALMISRKTGSFTLGESGKLNYGWEVNKASRWTHWQGEPGDLGTPLHPTRLQLRNPVPVYEFNGPVEGAYPPWFDPSYWYGGIQPHLEIARQLKLLGSNLAEAIFHITTSPITCIITLLILCGWGIGKWPVDYWALAIPPGAGILLYCLILPEKRYIGGFVVVLEMTILAGLHIRSGNWPRLMDAGVQAVCATSMAILLGWLSPQIAVGVRDLLHFQEGERNASWLMATRFQEIGVRPGDRIAYVGNGFEADWVRLLGAKIVAEVPAIHDRGQGIRHLEETDERHPRKFFDLDENSREKIYNAFRDAGAVIAVARNVPDGCNIEGWKRVLSPDTPGYPTGRAQISLQTPGYYRWLTKSQR